MAAAQSSKPKSQSKSIEAEEPIDVDGEQDEGEPEADEEEDEEEGEYEVQTICDHKMKNGRYEYLVAWKGYGPEHNTWEPEAHVAHAKDIVNKYWESQPKGNIVHQRKRGRPTTTSPGSSHRPTKALRTSAANGTKKAAPPPVDDEDEPLEYEDTHVDTLGKYEDVADWEDLVESIETIERNSKNELMVFMTMTGGEKSGQPTEVAYKRCPQKILKFYEAHLKWKLTE